MEMTTMETEETPVAEMETNDSEGHSDKLKDFEVGSHKSLADLEQEQDDEDDTQLQRSSARMIMSSDDEDNCSETNLENKTKPHSSASINRVKKRLITSDSEEDEINAEISVSDDDGLQDRNGSENENEEELPDIRPVYKSPFSHSTRALDPDVYGNNTSDEEERTSVRSDRSNSHDESEMESISKKGKKKQLTKRKASEKSREKTMKELASQTQKMVRESRVSLPYHKPKQLTLDEFLKKRNKAKAPLHSSLMNSGALGTMRGTIMKVEEDVLPLMAEVEKDEQKRKEDEQKQIEEEAKKIAKEDEIQLALSTTAVNKWLGENDGHEVDNTDLIDDMADTIDHAAEHELGLKSDLTVAETTTMTESRNQSPSVETNTTLSESVTIKTNDNIAAAPAASDVISETDSLVVSASDEVDISNNNELLEEVSGLVPGKNVNEKDEDAALINDQEAELVSTSTKSGTSDNNQILHEVSGPGPNDYVDENNEDAARIKDQEAELQAFMEAQKPKPKPRKSIAELLKSMPGYDQIASLKPQIGGSSRRSYQRFVELGDTKKSKKPKNTQGIQSLMDRFVKHASVTANRSDHPKEEHHKIHIEKTEKDSQGILHVVLDEVDYITPGPEDEDDLIAALKGTGVEMHPGEKMSRLKEVLGNQIRAKKAREYEKRLEASAAYENEKKLEEKDNEDEDIIDDEEIDLSDSENSESEEDEIEEDDDDVSSKIKNKTRTRVIYFDDEAEEEDAEGKSETEEEDEDMDVPKLINDDDQESQSSVNFYHKMMKNDDIHLADSLPSGRCIENENRQLDEVNDSISEESSVKKVGDELSDPIAKLVSKTTEPEEELLDLCSGKFPSQAPATPYETQDCFGFDIDDADDQDVVESCNGAVNDTENQNQICVSTPTQSQSETPIATCNPDTPKMSDKIVKSRSLGHRFEIEARRMGDTETHTPTTTSREKYKLDFENSSNNKLPFAVPTESNAADSDDEDAVGTKLVKKRKLRLAFSDDEDEDENVGSSDKESLGAEPDESDLEELEHGQKQADVDEEDEEEELERLLVLQSQPPKPKGLFGKDGKLRKKFVEEEAELSGSEEGSGDEDERGTNFYEKEEGDDDELDEDDVRNQVEKAHLKHLLDQDDRQVRLLQEEYLERGDLEDGRQRERKFRWSGVDDIWSDDHAQTGDSDGELDEDEDEIKRKYEAIERRKWIHEHSEVFEAVEEESQKQIFEKSKFLKLGKNTMKKIESCVDSSSSFLINESSSSIADTTFGSLIKSKINPSAKVFLSSSATSPGDDNDELDDDEEVKVLFSKAVCHPHFASPDEQLLKIKRGSFLSRAPSLSRFADIAKVNDNTTNVKNNSRSFVFSVVTPPDQASKQKIPKRPSNSQSTSQPTKMPRMDRSFSTLDDSSKDASIFKWF